VGVKSPGEHTNSDGQHNQLLRHSTNNLLVKQDVKKKVKVIKTGVKASRRELDIGMGSLSDDVPKEKAPAWETGA
jgi:hypothetical protein